jgi:MarR family transcriptional regulator, organic hydroperoxide resistance regulator
MPKKPSKILGSGDPAAADFEPDNYLFIALAHANHSYAERIAHALRSTGTDRSRWRVLMALTVKNVSSIKDLSELTTIKQSTVSKIIERMKCDGWIETSSRPSDTRVTDVRPTEIGREVLAKLVQIASKEYRAALTGVSEAELSTMLAALQKIRVNLQRY